MPLKCIFNSPKKQSLRYNFEVSFYVLLWNHKASCKFNKNGIIVEIDCQSSILALKNNNTIEGTASVINQRLTKLKHCYGKSYIVTEL